MRAALEVLLGNLRALKEEGATQVFVSDEALDALRKSVAEAVAESPVPAPAPARSRPTSSAVAPTVSKKRTPVAEHKNEPANPPSAPLAWETSAPPPPPPKAAAPRIVVKEEKKASDLNPEVSAERVNSVPAVGTNAERLAALCEQMKSDPVCNAHLHKGKHLVFGEGDPEASVFFCGEAPGAEEEDQGRPFVGPAGQLLTKMIAATGLSREQVYIGNIMKWRPELPTPYGNRPPTPEEMAYCLPYLSKQTEIIRPRVIVALGLSAVNGLLGFDPDRRIGAMRGRKLEYRGIPVVATYHPSYLLRNDSAKSKRAAWEDFLAMMEIAGLPISDRQRGFFLKKVG